MRPNLLVSAHRSVRSRMGHVERGVSMVEVLISIFVLSFGVLGMAGMQAAALQSNQEARAQAIGYGLSQELADMMRGNKDPGLDDSSPYYGDFQGLLTGGAASYCLQVGTTGCAGVTAAAHLTIARAQMTEWLERVNVNLPGARVVVCVDDAPYDGNGLPQWACTAPASSGTALPYIKIGWTQRSLNRTAGADDAMVRVTDNNSRPSLVVPIIAGSTT